MITPTTDLTMPAQSQEVEIAPREAEISIRPHLFTVSTKGPAPPPVLFNKVNPLISTSGFYLPII